MTTNSLELSEYYSWRTIKVGEIYKVLREIDTFTCDSVENLGTGLAGLARGRKIMRQSNVLILRKYYFDDAQERPPKESFSSDPSCAPIYRWIEVLESDQALWIPIPTEWLSRREMILLSEHEANLDDLASKLGASYHRPV